MKKVTIATCRIYRSCKGKSMNVKDMPFLTNTTLTTSSPSSWNPNPCLKQNTRSKFKTQKYSSKM